MVPEISCEALRQKIQNNDDFDLIDVREIEEYERANINKAVLIPLGQLEDRVFELDKDREIVVHCKMGGRSAQAVAFLQSQGFKSVHNLVGGILRWAKEIDPELDTF